MGLTKQLAGEQRMTELGVRAAKEAFLITVRESGYRPRAWFTDHKDIEKFFRLSAVLKWGTSLATLLLDLDARLASEFMTNYATETGRLEGTGWVEETDRFILRKAAT
jgi:hypothetical protein